MKILFHKDTPQWSLLVLEKKETVIVSKEWLVQKSAKVGQTKGELK